MVSSLMPTFNRLECVGAAIEYVFAKTGLEPELIVIDDNSNDGTVALAATFDDSSIRTFQNPSRISSEGCWNPVGAAQELARALPTPRWALNGRTLSRISADKSPFGLALLPSNHVGHLNQPGL
jgi:glycosyltransferase involved in cell wall biosynthesis